MNIRHTRHKAPKMPFNCIVSTDGYIRLAYHRFIVPIDIPEGTYEANVSWDDSFSGGGFAIIHIKPYEGNKYGDLLTFDEFNQYFTIHKYLVG